MVLKGCREIPNGGTIWERNEGYLTNRESMIYYNPQDEQEFVSLLTNRKIVV